MSIILKKFWYKIFDKPKYQNLKNLKILKKIRKFLRKNLKHILKVSKKKLSITKNFLFFTLDIVEM